MASLFDTLQAQAFRAGYTTRSKEARAWFQDKVKGLTVNRRALLKDDALERTSRTIAGNMYMYFYDPKHKETLPYYDRFPLTIFVEPAKDGFYGLNLHYLRPDIRAAFLDQLMKTAPKKITDKTRLMKMRYKLLAGVRKYKEFKPCFKHYLGDHVRSQFTRVPMTDWELAIFLPTEQFKKKQKGTVWKDSIKVARKF
tara:strand:+ start:77 stop:667 length:591 start_codon:yes stop_codon:yes gene_type:complete